MIKFFFIKRIKSSNKVKEIYSFHFSDLAQIIVGVFENNLDDEDDFLKNYKVIYEFVESP